MTPLLPSFFLFIFCKEQNVQTNNTTHESRETNSSMSCSTTLQPTSSSTHFLPCITVVKLAAMTYQELF